MNGWLVDRAGHHLHRLLMGSIAPDVLHILAPPHHHNVPSKKLLMGQGLGKSPIQVGHHVGDPLLGREHAPILGAQPEIPAEGGLDRSPVEDLSLDFRGFQSLCADEFDDEVGPLILSDML